MQPDRLCEKRRTKVKRKSVILGGSLLAVVLSACGNGETAVGRTDPNNANSVEAVLQQQMAAEEAPQPTVEIVVENPAEDAIPEDFGAEAWEMTGEQKYADACLKQWDWILNHQIDREGGEWWNALDENGNPILKEDKGGNWKTSYHNGRTCLELLHRSGNL